MNKAIFSVFCYLLLVSSANGQLQQSIETTKRVAYYIIKNTTYRFVDSKTNQVYSTPQKMPTSANIKTESIYNKWEYSNGVMAIGMMELSKALNDTAYISYVGKNFNFAFNHIAFFKEQYPKNPRPEFHNFLRMDKLDDCGALGAALTRYNQLFPNKQFSDYLQKAINHVSKVQDRLADGTLCRKEPRQMTIWADDLYMSVPFLASQGKANNKEQYFDDAIKQVEQFNKYLYDEHSGLYFHNWYSDVQITGVAHWLRCNGWLAMAQTELLSNLPASHPKRKALTDLLLRQIVGFSRFQDTTGLWHQVIDKPDSYLETSGTAMFVYTVAKAVNEGWIPKQYFTIAEEGWKGLLKKVTADGQVEDVCIGTGIKDNIAFYYSRPKKINDFHVSGAFLLAGSEMVRAYQNRK